MVAKLLTLKVQPVFVLVDTETADVQPAPLVQPQDISAASVGQLADLLEQARQQIEQAASNG